MENFLLSLTDWFANTSRDILKFKKLVLSGITVVTIFMLVGVITRTSLDMSQDSFLQQEDPAIAALDDFRSQFGSDESVFLVYRAKDGNVFSRESLQAIQSLTDDLRNWQDLDTTLYPEAIGSIPVIWEELSHMRRVQSLANVRIQENVGDSLLSNRLVPTTLPTSNEQLEDIRTKAMAQTDYLLAFYSEDGQYAAIMINTDFGTKPVEGYESAIDDADISLDASFADFDSFDTFDLEFDEEAAVQEVEFEAVDMLGYTNFAIALRAIYDQYDEQFEFYPVGTPALMGFMFDMMMDLAYLGVAMLLVFIILLWTLFRSFSAVVWPIVTIGISIAWAWGIAVWMGATITSMVALTVMLVFAVGIADCVHVMSAYFNFRREGLDHYDALTESYRKTGLAILVTSITTAAGMLALMTSDLQPIDVFAMMSAFGVMLAFFFTVTLLPLMLDLWHPGAPIKGELTLADKLGQRWTALPRKNKLLLILAVLVPTFAIFMTGMPTALSGFLVSTYLALIGLATYIVLNYKDPILAAVPRLATNNAKSILAIFTAIFVLCAYGTTQIRIDSNMVEMFREGTPLRIIYEAVDENMAGTQSMEIMIDTGEADGLLNPNLLKAVDALQTRIEERYPEEVTRTNSLANIVKDTNQIMNDDDPAFYTLPDTLQMNSQLLYLFNSANPEDRRALVSDDYSRSHVTINAYNAGSYQYQQFFIELTEDIESTFKELESEFPGLEVTVTGSMALLMRMADQIAQSQFDSFAFAIAIISIIMVITLGSLKGGLMAMIPNIIPALLSFGLMGLFGVPLDTDTLLIAPLILGIAVDDTIHFMTHYRVDLARTGSISKALASTIRDVGQAVMFTTMILGMGFATLSFAGYLGMAKVGFFGSLAIFVALLCDLFLIPAMITVFKPTFGVKDADTEINFDALDTLDASHAGITAAETPQSAV